MGWPVKLDPIPVWRNDRWSRTWPFFNPPPDWMAAHAYVLGVLGSGEYLANSTVSFGTTTDADGVETPVFYTCTSAHTSGASFDATKWTADPEAVGAPLDLTIYGDTVAGQIRKKQDDDPLASMDLDDSDLAAGEITAKFTAEMWTALDEEASVGFDIEIRSSSELPLTVLVGKFSIAKDWTHA